MILPFNYKLMNIKEFILKYKKKIVKLDKRVKHKYINQLTQLILNNYYKQSIEFNSEFKTFIAVTYLQFIRQINL